MCSLCQHVVYNLSMHSDVRGGGWCSAKIPRQGNVGLTCSRCADVCLGAAGVLRDGQRDATAYALATAYVRGFWFLNLKTLLAGGHAVRFVHVLTSTAKGFAFASSAGSCARARALVCSRRNSLVQARSPTTCSRAP
jgi:hypothetical protein